MKHTIINTYDIDYDAFNEYIKETFDEVEEDSNTYLEILADEQRLNWEIAEEELSEISADEGMIVIADLGLWYGRRSGYKEVKGYTVDKAMTALYNYDDVEMYVEDGDLHMVGYHHDGCNSMIVREWRRGLTDDQKEKFMNALYYGKATEKMIKWYTKGLGKKISAYYGWVNTATTTNIFTPMTEDIATA